MDYDGDRKCTYLSITDNSTLERKIKETHTKNYDVKKINSSGHNGNFFHEIALLPKNLFHFFPKKTPKQNPKQSHESERKISVNGIIFIHTVTVV